MPSHPSQALTRLTILLLLSDAQEKNPAKILSFSLLLKTLIPQNCVDMLHLIVPLKKEVIQPHVPVRLPCYDFTPLTSFAFVTCPPLGLTQPLRAPPTRVV